MKTGVTSTDWAEMIDVSQPVPEFTDKIKDMAQTYPFELDNFQKQVLVLNCISKSGEAVNDNNFCIHLFYL